MNPILLVGEPRHREVSTFAQGNTGREGQGFGVHILSCCAVLGWWWELRLDSGFRKYLNTLLQFSQLIP